MPIRADTYAPDRPAPYLLKVGATQTINCPIRQTADGALVAPTSGTVTITDPDGTALATAAAVTVTSSIATYSLVLAAGAPIGEGYDIAWTLVIATESYTWNLTGIGCDYVPPNVITAADLYGGEGIPELRYAIPQAQKPIANGGDGTGWGPQIDAAYYAFVNRLLADARPIWLVREAVGYREYLLAASIKNACDAIPAPEGSIWATYQRNAWHRLQRAEAGLRLQYSTDNKNVRRGGSPTIRLAPTGRPWC